MNNLGQIYVHGLGVEKDNAQAEKWYLRAVALGSMSARNSLGAFYGKGLGHHPKDFDKALPLVEASACQGYVQAQMNLASFYMENDGEAPVDYRKSYAWYYSVYKNGVSEAMNNLILLKKMMNDKDFIEAEKMALKYSKQYHSPATEDDVYRSKECPVL